MDSAIGFFGVIVFCLPEVFLCGAGLGLLDLGMSVSAGNANNFLALDFCRFALGSTRCFTFDISVDFVSFRLSAID